MRKLLRFLKGYKKECILSPLFKLLEVCFELFVPLVMAAIIDQGIAGEDTGFVMKMCGVLVLLAVVGLACSLTAQFFAAKAAVGFGTRVRHALFDHIQRLSYSEMDETGTDTLITRMTSDINQVQSGVNMVLRLFLRSPVVVFGAMIMAFTIDVKSAWIFVVAIPLLSLVVFGIMFFCIPLYRKVQAGLDRVLGITRQNLTGVRVIRAFNREEIEREAFEESNGTLTRMQLFVGRISGLMNPLTLVIINAALLMLIWTGAWQVDSGHILQGEVVALVNYMSQILVELVKLANLIITVTKAVACGNRVQSVFERQSSMEDGALAFPEESGEYMVRFSHVFMRYRGAGADTLTDIDFCVRPGETVGIIGGTGSGKSSVVNLIPRFYDVSEGQVLVAGVDVRELKQETLRDHIGVVPQKAVLFSGTIRSNLAWGNPKATEQQMQEALAIAQIWDIVVQKGGLDAEVEQGGRNFSGGQRQRLTIARALVRKPDILILDDSASALDYATDARLRAAIRGMEGSPAVFIVSQRTASIMHADRIVVLEDGTMAGIGTHEELLAQCRVYREIYDSQFKRQEETANEA